MKGTLCLQGLIVFICIIAAGIGGCKKEPPVKQIHIVFRFDDYSERSETELELEIIDAFRKNKATVTFGVVPFACTGKEHDPSPQKLTALTCEKCNILKCACKEGVVEAALHGHSHQSACAECLTEFSGLDYEAQVKKIARAKKYLEDMTGIPINIFVPPWNEYDLNTLHAIEKLGFSVFSADRYGEMSHDCNLHVLPFSCDLRDLHDAIKAARESLNTQPLIVVLFHQYDFKEIDEHKGCITYRKFRELLAELKSQKDICLLSLGQAARKISDLSARRFLSMQKGGSLGTLLPEFLADKSSDLQYHEAGIVSRKYAELGLFYSAIIFFAAACSLIFGSLVFPKSRFIMKFFTCGGIVVTAGLLVYMFHDMQVYIKGMIVGAGMTGVSLGFCMYWWLCKISLFRRKPRGSPACNIA